MNYYNRQAFEIFQAYSNNSVLNENNKSLPNYSFLTFDPDSVEVNRHNTDSGKSMHHELLLFFLQYLIAFPIFLLCWIALVTYLRRMGHITQSGAESMIDELKDIRIAARPPSVLK